MANMDNMVDSAVSASDWSKGISLSILASIIGGASKLAIRKSWLMEEEQKRQRHDSLILLTDDDEEDGGGVTSSAEQDPMHQRQSHHSLAVVLEEECEQDADADTTIVVRVEQPRQVQATEDSDSLHSLRSRRTVSRSLSGTSADIDLDMDVIAIDDDEDVRCCGGSKILARLLRGSGMIGMTLLNPLACVLAMNYASPSILAPFSGLTLVWIVLLSNPVIGEQPTAPQIMAACLIIFGEVIVALFGDHTNDEGVTVEDVRDSYFRTPFLLYFACLTLWMLLMFYWMLNRSVSPTLRRFAWGVSSGSITGLQNFLKDSSTILKANRAPGQGLPWYLPLFAILAILSAFSGLLLLTACMKRYDATYSSAMFVGSFVVSASIMSACHYSTFAHLETLWNKILYPAGLLILMGGVLLLVKEKKESPDDDEDEEDSTDTGTLEERSESETAQSKTRHREMRFPM